VFVHELGHYMAARSVGMRVEKFYIGFNLFGLGFHKTINGTEYGIGLVPLGGYVKVAGVLDESMDSTTTGAPDEFNSKNTLEKMWFLSAGVIMNTLLAIVIFSAITFNLGLSDSSTEPVIGQLLQNHPADSAGLIIGDKILSINEIPVSSWQELTNAIHNLPDQKIKMRWERNAQIFTDSIHTIKTRRLIDNEIKDIGMIGIAPVIIEKEAGLLQSIQNGVEQTVYWFKMTITSLGMIFSGSASIKDIGGPIIIAKMAGETAKAGIWNWLNFMAIISINLAFLNVLPIPGLDGGHMFFTIIEGIFRREIPPRIKMGIQQFGMLILLILMVIVIYNDVTRIIN